MPLTRLTNISNLDFIVLDRELLHNPWKNIELNWTIDKPSARVGMRWVAGLLVLLLAMPQAKAEGVGLCDRAAADPDAAIPVCTELIE
jgi:hypothetical protein